MLQSIIFLCMKVVKLCLDLVLRLLEQATICLQVKFATGLRTIPAS